MNRYAFHILRVGIAITFLWVGLSILKSPFAWGGYIQPWAMNWLPVPLEQAMIMNGILDIIIGFLLLIDAYTWIAALIAALHLAVVLILAGINDVTIRDVGLLAACLALFADTPLPNFFPQGRRKG